MSHDRKPGHVRVMQLDDVTPQRRRHDVPPVILDAASILRAAKAARRGRAKLIALFLLAAIGCAVAVALYLP